MSFLHKDPPTTVETTTQTTTTRVPLPASERKYAVCFGMNDYPGTNNDLNGCVNDANEWTSVLKDLYGFNVQTFINKDATAVRLINSIGNLIADSKALDHIVFTYSGHGTNVPDRNGDESDKRDEALCLYDRLLIDDELRVMFKELHPEARLTFISDSCHSGTVTRAFLQTMGMDKAPKPRYMPPEDAEAYGIAPSSVRRSMYPESDMNEILISGCLPSEYSYDARLGGRYMGAMSYYATLILKENPNLTYENFYKKLRTKLPSGRYCQTPQLEGSKANKAEKMFM